MTEPKAEITPSRRGFLTAASTAAGFAMVAEVSGRVAKGAGGEDQGTNIKISALRGFRVGTKAYIKIDTNRQITGWNEVTGLDPIVAFASAKSLFETLDGENPTRVEYLWQKLYRSHRGH